MRIRKKLAAYHARAKARLKRTRVQEKPPRSIISNTAMEWFDAERQAVLR
jgi:hypothetical protein